MLPLVFAVHIIHTKLTNPDDPRLTMRQLLLRSLTSKELAIVIVKMMIKYIGHQHPR